MPNDYAYTEEMNIHGEALQKLMIIMHTWDI